jgi:predicted MFS family arabinose efflux permease
MAGNRLAVPIALLLAIVCCIAAPALLLFHTDATTFLAAVIFFHFGWNLGHAYLLALFARLDASSHLIFMATAMQKIGIAAGPAIATVMYGRKGGDAVLLLALVIGLVALAALTPAARRQATAAL